MSPWVQTPSSLSPYSLLWKKIAVKRLRRTEERLRLYIVVSGMVKEASFFAGTSREKRNNQEKESCVKLRRSSGLSSSP